MGLAIAGVVAGTAFLALIEWPALKRLNARKDTLAFFILLGAGAAFSIAWIAKAPIPNPVELIIYMYKPISVFLDKFLQ